MANRRVLMIAYHFPPDLEVGARRTARFVKYLPSVGWDPVVLTVEERYYPSKDAAIPMTQAPVFRTSIMPGPRELVRRILGMLRRGGSTGGGSEVSATGESAYVPPQRASALKRVIFSLLWLPDDRQGWILPGARAAARLSRQHSIDALYTTGPPWTNHLVGLLASIRTGKPWVADFRDPWQGGRGKPIFVRSWVSDHLDSALERWVFRRAAVVICVCERQRRQLLKDHPKLPPQKLQVIPNGFDPDEMTSLTQLPAARSQGVLTITYAGKLYLARSPESLLMALRSLRERGIVGPEGVRLRFLGKCDHVRGVPLLELAARYGVEDLIDAPGELPRAQCLEELRRSDALLLLATDQKDQVPAKLFEYLMMDRPILAFTEQDSATAEVLRHTGDGMVVDQDDRVEVEATLERLIRSHHEGALHADRDLQALASYAADQLTHRLSDVLNSAIAGGVRNVRAGSRT